jgi:hypothetical protein
MAPLSAQVTCLGQWTHAVLVDLSLTGAQLDGDDLPAPGSWARLQFNLGGFAFRGETMSVWRQEGRRRVGLSFDPLSVVQRRAIADALMRADLRADEPAGAFVTLVNGSPRLAEVSRVIHEHGFAVNVATTPAEAIRLIVDAHPPVRAAIVARDPSNRSSEQLLEVLAATQFFLFWVKA